MQGWIKIKGCSSDAKEVVLFKLGNIYLFICLDKHGM